MRLFVAADLSDEQRDVLRVNVEEAKAAALFPYVRWIPEENWHATLAFLGDCDESRLAEIQRQIDSVVSQEKSLEASPVRIQAFPHRDQPRLLAFKLNPEQRVREVSWKMILAFNIRERPRNMRLHVTVARFRELDSELAKELNEAIRDLSSVSGPSWQLPSVTLYESILKQSGAEYRALKTWQLG